MCDELQGALEHLLLGGNSVTSHGLDTLRIKLGFNLIGVFVLEAHVALLCLKDAREVNLSAINPGSQLKGTSTHLLKFEFNRRWITGCDLVGDVVSDPKRLLFRLARQVYEQRVRVTVNNPRSPSIVRFDERNSLFKGFPTRLDDRVCDLNSRHTTGKGRACVAIRDIRNELEGKLSRI